VAVRIAVVDPLPMFQHGVAAVLSAAGHAVDVPSDVLAWVVCRQSALVLLTMAGEAEWHLLGRLCRAGTPVIAMTDGSSGVLGARAIRLGARSVLPRDADAAVLRRTVEASADGQSVMPAAVATLLTGSAGADVPRISAAGATWLKQLASGTTVAQLAARSGYSERAMFRLLRSLYREMGVDSRVEAIMRAREWNWI
jgi:DNA-binding NarL/FixJ family response regulator